MHEQGLAVGRDISVCAVDGAKTSRNAIPSRAAFEVADCDPYVEACMRWLTSDAGRGKVRCSFSRADWSCSKANPPGLWVIRFFADPKPTGPTPEGLYLNYLPDQPWASGTVEVIGEDEGI